MRVYISTPSSVGCEEGDHNPALGNAFLHCETPECLTGGDIQGFQSIYMKPEIFTSISPKRRPVWVLPFMAQCYNVQWCEEERRFRCTPDDEFSIPDTTTSADLGAPYSVFGKPGSRTGRGTRNPPASSCTGTTSLAWFTWVAACVRCMGMVLSPL